jgi:hypothetical protein
LCECGCSSGIIVGEDQFAQPEQRLGFGHLLAGGGREFPRALKRGAGRAELAEPQPGDPEPAQDIRLPDRITELADDGQRLVERGDGAGRAGESPDPSATEPVPESCLAS